MEKKIYGLYLDDDNNIMGVTFGKYSEDNMPLVHHIPEDDITFYRYIVTDTKPFYKIEKREDIK